MEVDDYYYEARDAIRGRDLRKLQELCEACPEIVTIQLGTDTLLDLAAGEGNRKACQELLQRGADVNASVLGGTPLTSAALNGHVQIVRDLIAAGAILYTDVEANALLSAAGEGQSEIVKVLIDAGMDPNFTYRSVSGMPKNALSYALEMGHEDTGEVLRAAGAALPTEAGILQYGGEPMPPEEIAPEVSEKLREVLGAVYGPPDVNSLCEVLPSSAGVRIAIHVIVPSDESPECTLFTTGMSDQAMTVPRGQEDFAHAELIMHLPGDWPHPRSIPIDHPMNWPVRWLRDLAYYPHLNDTWLGGRHTIITPKEPPPPLGPDTELRCLLLIADFDAWSPIPLDDGKRIHFYTVTPLYTEERDFEKKHGIVALLERLHASGATTVVDLRRKNVALTTT